MKNKTKNKILLKIKLLNLHFSQYLVLNFSITHHYISLLQNMILTHLLIFFHFHPIEYI